ncbi:MULTISPECIES: hypothetical protein [Brevibacillus]|uniref:hypothetical protein n=1 Tax=Brevibacillus TaxID=55080 RepID=UPI000E38F450|nr:MULTISPECIES: hypothetical protein [Brevibacillus]RED34213.1 hypothetical protein DES34_102383 [Brevibacillus brevis]TQK62933.1 hypothetical protein FB479_104251 [Brevibacillus sp. AG162]GEC91434.1 hypothetical protein BBR01nite_37650 [Brevibacillus brevis]VEF92217.1 Uncharacterised protein [Brevibacillus brevis]
MKLLNQKSCLHAFFTSGRIDLEYRGCEGCITQLLEMGQKEEVPGFDQMLVDIWLYR